MRRWRRLGLCLAGAALLCAGLAVLLYRTLPGIVPEERLRDALAAHAATWTGGELRLGDDAELSLDRGIGVTLTNATFTGTRGGADWSLEVDTLEASLRILPLLRGRVEIERLALDRPRLRLGDAIPTAVPVPADVSAAPERPDPIGEVILTDARVAYDGAALGPAAMSDLDLRMVAVPDTAAVRLTGAFDAGARRMQIEGWLDDPAAAFSETGSAGRLALRGAESGMSGGDGTPPPPPDMPETEAEADGEIVSAARRLAARMGLPAYGPVAVEGRFALTPRSFDITDATVSVSGTLVDGDLTIALDDDAPPLGRVVEQARTAWQDMAAAVEDGAWRSAELPLDWLAPLEISLDAQARDGKLSGADLETARLRLDAHGGRARLDVLADGDPGRLQVDLLLRPALRGGTEITASGTLDDVILEQAARALLNLGSQPLVGLPRVPEGTLDAELDLTTGGRTVGAIVAALDGSLVTYIRDGSFPGADLVLTLEGLAEGREFMSEEGGPLIPAAGRTVFDTVEGRVEFARDAARLDALRIVGERYVIDMHGEVDMRMGEMRAEGRAVLLGDGSAEPGSEPLVDLPFGFGGTLAAPVVAAGVPRTDIAAEADDALVEEPGLE